MRLTINKAVYLIWGIFFTYWFLSSFFNKAKSERQESIPSRLLYLTPLSLAISLIVFDPVVFGPLLWRFLPAGTTTYLIGFVILVFGLGFAVWARIHLGRYWSARISLVQNHQLIQTGPYRLVRNPIYFGALVAVFGTAIVVGEIRAIIALLLALAAFLLKISQEEKWMRERFGLEFIEYQQEVKSLIPFVF
jgi:protein-S-isoprenylcysteine O-methyltransferase Ste14